MTRTKGERNEIHSTYTKHEIVWAKIERYPWWPAYITCLPSKNLQFYKVNFIGDRSYAYLAESKIAKYLEYRDEFSISQKPNGQFAKALALAARKYQESRKRKGSDLIDGSFGAVSSKTKSQKQQLKKQIEFPHHNKILQQSTEFSVKNSPKKQGENLRSRRGSTSRKNSFYLEIKKSSEDLAKEKQNKIKSLAMQPEKVSKKMELQNSQEQKNQQETGHKTVQQKRQKMLQQLLCKYGLDEIPEPIFTGKKSHKDGYNKKFNGKKKQIKKGCRKQQHENRQEVQIDQEKMLAKKIYEFLVGKLGPSHKAREIAFSLKDQLMKQKQNKAEYLKKLIEWLRVAEEQNIVEHYQKWVSFFRQSEGEKLSHLTMEAESEEPLTAK